MDACAGGDQNMKGACTSEVGNVQAMTVRDDVGASTVASPMGNFIETANECTELGMVDSHDMGKTATADIEVDDVQNTNGSFIPNAPAEMKPTIGMVFTSLDEAFSFYNNYAWLCGFSVRKDASRKDKDGVTCMRILRCSKAGVRYQKPNHVQPNKRRPPPLTRWCCPAKVVFNLQQNDNVYRVTQFIELHNHVLCTPSKTHRLRSHKRLTADHLNMITSMKKSGIGVARSIDFMRAEVGGPSQLGFSEKDARNALTRQRHSKFGNDADSLLRYFELKQKEDPQFTYDILVDQDMRLQSCFWVDRQAKEDYMVFNDVICFDTTYKTNEYDMPLGLFVGVNHHMQTVLLGVGLLFGETIEDFKWLFQTWLGAMGGVQPNTMITDQDPAIKQAILTVFPNAHHMLCLWHINKKVPDKLSHVIHKHPTFMTTWNNCLYGSIGIDEYEKAWAAMIEEFSLHGHSWLSNMYAIRQMWIPAYTKCIFSAGMRTTGRSESMNAFFDGFFTHRSTLMDIANGYEKALEKRREDESAADFKDVNGKPVLRTRCSMEAAMANIYTMKVFLGFQEEMETSMYYVGSMKVVDGVEQWHVYKFEKRGQTKGRMVTWNEDDSIASCQCMKFESCGIVCRHILAIFRLTGILTMPPKHLLARWTRTAKAQVKQRTDLSLMRPIISNMMRSYILSKQWAFLQGEALHNPAAFDIVKDLIDNATAKVLKLPKNKGNENASTEELQLEGGETGNADDNFNFSTNEVNVAVHTLHGGSSGVIPSQSSQACPILNAPLRNAHKGRVANRLKGHLEQPRSGKRLCRGCHEYVVGHDKRTCPHLRGLVAASEQDTTNDVPPIQSRGRGRRGTPH